MTDLLLTPGDPAPAAPARRRSLTPYETAVWRALTEWRYEGPEPDSPGTGVLHTHPWAVYHRAWIGRWHMLGVVGLTSEGTAARRHQETRSRTALLALLARHRLGQAVPPEITDPRLDDEGVIQACRWAVDVPAVLPIAVALDESTSPPSDAWIATGNRHAALHAGGGARWWTGAAALPDGPLVAEIAGGGQRGREALAVWLDVLEERGIAAPPASMWRVR